MYACTVCRGVFSCLFSFMQSYHLGSPLVFESCMQVTVPLFFITPPFPFPPLSSRDGFTTCCSWRNYTFSFTAQGVDLLSDVFNTSITTEC